MKKAIDHSLFLGKMIGKKTLNEWNTQFIQHMKSIDAQFDPGHRLDHVLRVSQTALALASEENARLEIVLPSAVLHDSYPLDKFSKKRHEASSLSANNTIELLKSWDYPSEFFDDIHHAVLCHSYSAGFIPSTLEAKVVQDADRLDALGAIGIARAMAVGFKHGNPLYDLTTPFPLEREADDKHNILDHFYLKLFNLADTLHTKAAQKEAQIRIERMEYYLQGLASEIGVEYLSPKLYKKKITNIKENTMEQKTEFCAGTLGIKSPDTLRELISTGYTTFDLATAYQGGHQMLGEVLEGMDRQHVKICSKINDGDLIKQDFSIRRILDNILTQLKTTYVDILMLHSPALLMHARATEVLEELITLKKEGVIKEIGVSNFLVSDLERLGDYRSCISYNQIELSPYCTRSEIVEYCNKHAIQIMAYGTFGRGKSDVLTNKVLTDIANAHEASPQQIILAWCLQQGIVPVVKASSKPHMLDNLKAYDLSLQPEEMNAISKLDRGLLTCAWRKFVVLEDIDKFTAPLVKPQSPQVSLNTFANLSSKKLVDFYLSQQQEIEAQPELQSKL